jgi:outer membrane protein
MNKTIAIGVMGVLAALSPSAQAGEDWMFRVRAAVVSPDASSGPVTGLDADNSFSPELDLTYFFTKNIAVEAIAATTTHTVSLNGADLGDVSVLPPTVTLQYHFNPEGSVRPYVGAGVNYTRFYDVELPAGLDVDRNSWGAALQVGVDFKVGANSYINLDLKKIFLETDVTSSGAYLTTLELDPWVFGIGYGFRF